MTVIDIYHIESRPMFFNMNTEQVISGQEAIDMRKRCGRCIRFVKYEEGVRMPSLGNRIAYGFAYEV